MRPRHFLYAVAAASLWGGGGVAGVLFGDHVGVSPLGIAAWRMAIAGIALLGFLAVTGMLRPSTWSPAAWRRMVATGLLTAAFEAAFFGAIHLSSVGLATLIGIGSAPVFVALYDAVVLHIRPAPRSLAASGLALVGLVLLVGGGIAQEPGVLGGALLACAAGGAFAAITIVNRRPVPGLGAIDLTGVAFTVGAVVIIPFALWTGLEVPTDAKGWLLALLMGLAFTALAYALYLTALQTVPPFVATVVTLLEPLIGAILGALLLSERLGVLGIIGGALLGTAVVMLRPQRDEPATIH